MKPVVAKKYLCFDAVLEMIISDICADSYFSQVVLAEMFGITVPIGEYTLIKNCRYSTNIKECGTVICVDEINDFFKVNCIPLELSFIKSNYINEMDFIDFINTKKRNAYIVFAFCYGILYNITEKNDIGHVSLLDTVYENKDLIKIYDPGPSDPGIKLVKSDDMFQSMRRRGGVYLFNRI